MKPVETPFGARLRELRERRGLTQEELGRRFNLSKQAISSYEAGGVHPPPKMIARFAEFFNVTTDYLLGRTDKPTPSGLHYVTEDGTVVPGAWPVGPTVKVPILGVIRAGEPLYAEQNIEGWADIPEEQARTGRFFFLRVHGDSMLESGIRDGALVLVKEQPDVEDGQVAVVMVNAEDATIKRVYKANGKLILKADNPRYPPLLVEPREARVIGRVVEVRFRVE